MNSSTLNKCPRLLQLFVAKGEKIPLGGKRGIVEESIHFDSYDPTCIDGRPIASESYSCWKSSDSGATGILFQYLATCLHRRKGEGIVGDVIKT